MLSANYVVLQATFDTVQSVCFSGTSRIYHFGNNSTASNFSSGILPHSTVDLDGGRPQVASSQILAAALKTNRVIEKEALVISRKKKPAVTLPGTVEKIIPTKYEPEKAEIAVEGADPLYKEIRIENTLQDEEGQEVSLKPGAQVDVTIEAGPDSTNPKRPVQSESDEAEPEAKAGTR